MSNTKNTSQENNISGGENKVSTTKRNTRSRKKVEKIYIEHGKRDQAIEKKVTLEKTTIELLDRLLEGLSNQEKSKALEVILVNELNRLLELKDQDLFSVAYKPIKEQKLI